MQAWHRACPLSEVGNDAPVGVTIADQPIGIFRAQGELYAIHDICTHQHARLSQGYPEGHLIECPLHEAKFDVRTGRCVSGPGNGDVKTFETKVEAEAVWVKV
jgi:nitrite reductase/ring-hydroxylating ferredoxin subunit